jgi:hypothetical protein
MEEDTPDVFEGRGVEVRFAERRDFLKIMETLTRIGTASKKDKVLTQTCHILHKRGRYAILHHKELVALDRKPVDIVEEDIAMRNTIAKLLHEWKLLEPIDSLEDVIVAPIGQVKVLHYSEKDDWTLVSKYTIGSKSKS